MEPDEDELGDVVGWDGMTEWDEMLVDVSGRDEERGILVVTNATFSQTDGNEMRGDAGFRWTEAK